MVELQDELIGRNLPTAHQNFKQGFEEGYWWPGSTADPGAYTMIGTKRLDQLALALEDLDERGVPGDLIETGVWRGGVLVWMARHSSRHVYGADSFQGVPPPTWSEDKECELYKLDFLSVSEEQVRANLHHFGVSDRVELWKGWFHQSLPLLDHKTWALIRLDGDLYESTYIALENLYPRLSPGGYCVVDDYGAILQCQHAVNDFRRTQGITSPMTRTDHSEVWWLK